LGETSILNEVAVEKWVYGGDALARVDGRVVLAPFVLPGERVRLDVDSDIHAGLAEVLEGVAVLGWPGSFRAAAARDRQSPGAR